MTFKSTILFFCTISSATFASKLNVVTTLPDLAEVVRIVGGEEVRVESLLKGVEDAHFVDAVPSYIVKISKADMVCLVGLGLEVGWMPKVLSKSANANVQPSGKGYCEMGRAVSVLDQRHGAVDRSMGDVHPEGNPHFYLSPVALSESSQEVLRVLSLIRPEKSQYFAQNQKQFSDQMAELFREVSEILKAAKGMSFVEYHKDFGYFFKVYGLRAKGSIEEKPGVTPSAARLKEISKQAQMEKVTAALVTGHAPSRQIQKFKELSGVPTLVLPSGVQSKDEQKNTIAKVQRFVAQKIVELGQQQK